MNDAKKKVLERWPDAVCLWFSEGATSFWGVISAIRGHTLSGTWNNEQEAWADAARRIEEEKRG